MNRQVHLGALGRDHWGQWQREGCGGPDTPPARWCPSAVEVWAAALSKLQLLTAQA